VGRLHQLFDGARPIGYCCQGVGCEIALADENRGFALQVNENRTIFNDNASVWPDAVRDYFGFTETQSKTLLGLNDSHPDDDWSHVIVYLHGLLDATEE